MLSAALLLSFGVSAEAYAMPPNDHIPEGCSEETWNRMQDNLIEWDEIGDLVQYYNPAYTSAFGTADSSAVTLESAYSGFVQDMHDTMEETDNTLDELRDRQRQIQKMPAGSTVPGMGTKEEALKTLDESMKLAKSGRRQVASSIRSMERSVKNTPKTIERQLMPVKKQLTFAMEGIVLSYEQLVVSREMAAAQVKLYESVYAMQQNLKNTGNATEYDVLLAKSDLDKANASLSKLDTSMGTVRRSIGLQLGWDAEALPEIGTVPEPEVSFVDTTNPDADKTAAIMHNREVRNAGKAQYSSSYGFELRDKTENEITGMLIAKMDSLYADMKEKKALYETAQTTLEKARLTKEAAERKYALGMLGRSEYEAQQLAYISYEASYELAKLNLFQSINTYQWAVDGVVTLDT